LRLPLGQKKILNLPLSGMKMRGRDWDMISLMLLTMHFFPLNPIPLLMDFAKQISGDVLQKVSPI
jgi:hypothetical protein